MQPTNPAHIHRNILQIKSRIKALNIAAYKPYSNYLYVGNLDTSSGHDILFELKRIIPFGKQYIMFSSYCIIEFNTIEEAFTECNHHKDVKMNDRKLLLNVLKMKQVDQFLLKPSANMIDNNNNNNEKEEKKQESDSISTISSSEEMTNNNINNIIDLNTMSKVFIGNLPYQASEIDIHALVEKFGSIMEIIILRRQDGTSRGAGFVKFYSPNDAIKCVNALNNVSYGNRTLNLKLEKSYK